MKLFLNNWTSWNKMKERIDKLVKEVSSTPHRTTNAFTEQFCDKEIQKLEYKGNYRSTGRLGCYLAKMFVKDIS